MNQELTNQIIPLLLFLSAVALFTRTTIRLNAQLRVFEAETQMFAHIEVWKKIPVNSFTCLLNYSLYPQYEKLTDEQKSVIETNRGVYLDFSYTFKGTEYHANFPFLIMPDNAGHAIYELCNIKQPHIYCWVACEVPNVAFLAKPEPGWLTAAKAPIHNSSIKGYVQSVSLLITSVVVWVLL